MKNCNCTYPGCSRKGFCCECLAYHLSSKELPACCFPADVEKTLNFALESKFTFAAYNILMPYPNTALYKKLEEENRLLYDGKWWLHPEYRFNHASFKPKSMSADQLTEAVYQVRKIWNSNNKQKAKK